MKYNTIGSSSLLGTERRKSTLTIYANLDLPELKMVNKESDISTIKEELQTVQNALKQQTARCRQLVEEYTKKLLQKEYEYRCERTLRDNQLGKVLRALLIMEARLKQEQKFINHHLKEKDYIIRKQNNDIKKLLLNQYCKNCNQYYSPSPQLESIDTSSECVGTDYQESNFGSLDSSETYATLSERDYNSSNATNTSSLSGEDVKISNENPNIYLKNKGKDSLGRRSRKITHRKSIGTYFEVLKLRNDSLSPCSNEDNTSNDYENFDSLPPESLSEKCDTPVSAANETVSELADDASKISDDVITNNNTSISESTITVIHNNLNKQELNLTTNSVNNDKSSDNGSEELKMSTISDSISVFDTDGETNDNWYASASDQEDEEQRDIYRNNPVLECVNQILLQNMNDANTSPPKTPNVDRKTSKSKKVKFSDEKELSGEKSCSSGTSHSYYETPIQKVPNYYETPQSIYSNDYEQICNKDALFTSNNEEVLTPKSQLPSENKSNVDVKKNHLYIDMDCGTEKKQLDDSKVIRKNKKLRTPPALPPKPVNLVSKYKVQNIPIKTFTEKSSEASLDSEPEYCSISELNLPLTKNVSFKKINVVAEINSPTSQDVLNKMDKVAEPSEIIDDTQAMLVKKPIEKINIQVAKQTSIISDNSTSSPLSLKNSPKKVEPEIPKLPQVSEIIIPDENEEKCENERIAPDNYIKNNSQIIKTKKKENVRRPIIIGTSVSNLISGFNNKELMNELNKKLEKQIIPKKMFTSFENLQNLDKQPSTKTNNVPSTIESYDLSQNFEEFKLDDCEIEEYTVTDLDDEEDEVKSEYNDHKIFHSRNIVQTEVLLSKPDVKKDLKRVDMVRVKNDCLIPNLDKNHLELLKKQLELQKLQKKPDIVPNKNLKYTNEPTYEQFLECTGLSSKSILSPGRMNIHHNRILKPKDLKKTWTNVKSNITEPNHGAMKYWSEPYV